MDRRGIDLRDDRNARPQAEISNAAAHDVGDEGKAAILHHPCEGPDPRQGDDRASQAIVGSRVPSDIRGARIDGAEPNVLGANAERDVAGLSRRRVIAFDAQRSSRDLDDTAAALGLRYDSPAKNILHAEKL